MELKNYNLLNGLCELYLLLTFPSELIKEIRNWKRESDLNSLLYIEPTQPTTTLEFTLRGLSGEITGYKEVTASTGERTRTATNSTSLERKPANYENSFVRGKSSYFPFRPGGLGELDLDDELEEGKELDAAAKGLEKAFEKGRGKSPLALSFYPFSTSGTDHERMSRWDSNNTSRIHKRLGFRTSNSRSSRWRVTRRGSRRSRCRTYL